MNRILAPLLAAIALLPSCFSLDRADGLTPGTVRGTISLSNGSPARNAAIALPALSRIVRADSDGNFRLTGIPVGGHAIFATFDEDADGNAEEGAVRSLVQTLRGQGILRSTSHDNQLGVDQMPPPDRQRA